MRDKIRRAGLIAIGAVAVAVFAVVLLTARRDERTPSAPRHSAPAPRWAAPPASAKSGPPPGLDTAELRRRTATSSYWRDQAPTDDPAERTRRDEDSRRWNAIYGRVLEGTASLEEIDRYYDHLRQRSEDDLRVVQAALAQPSLSERDRGLFGLAARMHRDRLAGLPRERQQAIERRQLQEQRRAAWRASLTH
jgi:hypothetical protein